MSASNDDSEQSYVLGLVLALIAFVLFLVVGIVLHHHRGAAQAKAAAAARPAAVAVVTESTVVAIPDGASVRIEGSIVKFYFATGSAELAAGADQALAAVLQGVQAGRKAAVSGFHDTTGDAAVNEALARQRAEAVQATLVRLGVPAERVDLRKPEQTAGSGDNAQARRVEVILVD